MARCTKYKALGVALVVILVDLILLCSMKINDVLNTKHELRYKIYKLRNSNVWQLLFDACISILENPLAICV